LCSSSPPFEEHKGKMVKEKCSVERQAGWWINAVGDQIIKEILENEKKE